VRRCHPAGRGLVGGLFLGSFLPAIQGYSALHTGLSFLPVVAATILGHAACRLDGRALASYVLALAAAGAAAAVH